MQMFVGYGGPARGQAWNVTPWRESPATRRCQRPPSDSDSTMIVVTHFKRSLSLKIPIVWHF